MSRLLVFNCKSRWLVYSLCVLLSVYLLAAVLKPSLADISATLMALIGLVFTVGSVKAVKTMPFSKWELVLLMTFSVYSFISLISFCYFDIDRNAQMRLEDDIKFLLLLPLYLLLRQLNLNAMFIVCLFTFIAFVLGMVSIAQYLSWDVLVSWVDEGGRGGRRPSGAVNPMRYAAVALIVAICALNVLVVFSCKSKIRVILAACGFVMAVVACLLTQTRGVWLALPLLVLLYFWLFFKGVSAHRILLLFCLSGIGLGVVFQGQFVQKRIGATLKNMDRYQQGDGRSSLGVRLDLYKVSLNLIGSAPLFGHGLGSFKKKVSEVRSPGVLTGRVSKGVSTRRTPHNELLQAMVERGVFGLVITLLLFVVPGYIFHCALSSDHQASVYYGLNGLVLLFVFFIAGQTGTLFNHNVFTHFYIIMVLLFVSQIRRAQLDVGAEEVSEVKGVLG